MSSVKKMQGYDIDLLSGPEQQGIRVRPRGWRWNDGHRTQTSGVTTNIAIIR